MVGAVLPREFWRFSIAVKPLPQCASNNPLIRVNSVPLSASPVREPLLPFVRSITV